MTSQKIIPDYIGVKEIQDLFRKWIREPTTKLQCSYLCPFYQDCHADVGCFERALVDFMCWLKNQKMEMRST